MAYVTSSVLGADFNNASSTALFALGQRVLGSDNSEWVYVKATGTLVAGLICSVQAAGTAVAPTTAYLLAPTGVAGGGALAVPQCTALQGYYVWAATRGQGLILAASGTIAAGAQVYLGGVTEGALTTTAGSCTMAGIFVTTSASTGTFSQMARGTLTYPRSAGGNTTPLQ